MGMKLETERELVCPPLTPLLAAAGDEGEGAYLTGGGVINLKVRWCKGSHN